MNSPETPATSGSYTFSPPTDAPVVAAIPQTRAYAGFIVRLAAFVVDFIIIYTFLILTTWGSFEAFRWADGPVTDEWRIYSALVFFWVMFPFVYYVFFLTDGGQTPGKRALRIKVFTVEGDELGGGRAAFRTAGYFFSASFFMIGFIWAAFDPHHQTWHDKIAGTVVLEI